MATKKQKIEVLIEKLQNIARLTEQGKYPEDDERTLKNFAIFKDMTNYQSKGFSELIEHFSSKTGIRLNYWVTDDTDNHMSYLIKWED